MTIWKYFKELEANGIDMDGNFHTIMYLYNTYYPIEKAIELFKGKRNGF